MSIEVSIILPSYNRYPLNLLTLYSLENQRFDLSKMEVVLIDDASTDDTHLLKNYSPPYPFQYIRNKQNEGRSKTRNIGIKAAKGKILIFLDAEIIVDRNFVSSHYQRHSTNEPVVITGKSLNRIYSFLFPDFNQDQLKAFDLIVNQAPMVRKRVRQGVHPTPYKIEELTSILHEKKRPIQLLFKEDFRSLSKIKRFSAPMLYYQSIIKLLREDFRLPWIACNGFHSVNKERVEAVGGFDESFDGHGLEDFEYGFRLYQSGVKFYSDPNINAYHQEHPIGSDVKNEGNRNLIRFQQKHPCLDIYLLSLTRIDNWDYTFMDNILREHETISQNHSGRFDQIMKAILVLLKQIPLLKVEDKSITALVKAAGLEADEEWKNRVWFERNELERYGFLHVKKLFDLLVHL